MTRAGSRHVAVWIDPHEAVLLAFESESLDGPARNGSGDGWSQERVDAQQYPGTQQYYGAVLSHLKPCDQILILGPGKTRQELHYRIEQQGGTRGEVVGLFYASSLANVEVIFPIGGTWRSEKAGQPRWKWGRGQATNRMRRKEDLRQASYTRKDKLPSSVVSCNRKNKE